jgi:hypothetical protein
MLSVDQTMEKVDRTCNAPSETKNIDHALMISYQYTWPRLKMFLAFHYDP